MFFLSLMENIWWFRKIQKLYLGQIFHILAVFLIFLKYLSTSWRENVFFFLIWKNFQKLSFKKNFSPISQPFGWLSECLVLLYRYNFVRQLKKLYLWYLGRAGPPEQFRWIYLIKKQKSHFIGIKVTTLKSQI